MKIKIEIKNRFTGKVLFEFETEDNTTKKTLEKAREQGAYLRGADLEGADLRGAYLEGADLEGAYLRGAYLRGAYLRGAYLEGAYLEGAYLEGAYLEGAYLRGADLNGKKIRKIGIFTGLYKYLVKAYTTECGETRIALGCHDRTLQEWENDFWNNLNEFPNNGCIPSKLRVNAYEFAKTWLEINKEG